MYITAGFIQSERTQTLVTSRGISALYKVLLLNGVLNLGLPFPSQVDNQPDNVHYHGNREEQELEPSCVLMRRVQGKEIGVVDDHTRAYTLLVTQHKYTKL